MWGIKYKTDFDWNIVSYGQYLVKYKENQLLIFHFVSIVSLASYQYDCVSSE
jgi:hypothetical protein